MTLTVREMRPEEARAYLEVHRAAVRGLATGHYPAEVIHAWAPLPVTDGDVERLGEESGGELRLVALRGGRVVGIGALAAATREVSACYVAPGEARTGVGSALLAALEAEARRSGLGALETDSSLNAEPFYRALGYRVVKRGTHRLAAGPEMAAVRMRKDLGGPDVDESGGAKRLFDCPRFD